MTNDFDGQEITETLRRLVAFPTESRTSNAELIDYYAERAAATGATIDVVAGASGADGDRNNLHVRLGPDEDGGILLSGHTDVVPAGSGWATDPYDLTSIDGRLHGRGTADMKGFLAAALVVLENLDPSRLRRPVHLGLSYDEEIGCVGVGSLLKHMANLEHCRPTMTIVGEPTSMQLCTAHSGKRVFRLAVAAASGHSSRSPHEPTAIEAAGAVVNAVAEINAASRDGGGGFSANVGTISGGVAVNVLSPSCELDFECRHQANVDPCDLLKPLFDVVDQWRERLQAVGGGIDVEPVVSYPALATDADDPAVSSLHRSLNRPEVSEAASVGFGQVSFGCEAGLYADALSSPAVIFGPGDIADAHRPDEYIVAADLAVAAQRLGSAIEQFCVDVP